MELEGGDQTDDTLGYKLRNFGKLMVCRYFRIRKLIQTAVDPDEGIVFEHARQSLRMDSGIAELKTAHGTVCLEKRDGLIFRRNRMSRHFVTICRLIEINNLR